SDPKGGPQPLESQLQGSMEASGKMTFGKFHLGEMK
ncbi:MAG: hypothetical protein JWO94_3807, partial [Verrucomicrobiaceae bacterium]|nr:hypothetical protein [Verrucomicrobiaceae bacterium]